LQQEFRGGTGYVFDTTSEQEAAIDDYVRNANRLYEANRLVVLNVYNLITRNCGQVAYDAVKAGGVPLHGGFLLLPSNLNHLLQSTAKSVRRYESRDTGMTVARWVSNELGDAVANAYNAMSFLDMILSW
jgi:hypothetical protein